MVGKKEFGSAKGIVDYHERHLSTGEYHLEEGRAQGVFFGELAREWKLDLNAIVSKDERFTSFAELDVALLSGQKELRRPRQSARQAIDFTYSAPKSVSVAGVFDSRLRLELRAAVIEELRWFERHAAARDRRGALYDTETSRRTGKFLGAAFIHETSRAGDPDLHCHCLIANVTIDPERRQALALDYGEMFELRKTLDARIQNNLAARCYRLGYTVEVAAHGFRLREIPLEIEEIHSVRTKEIRTARALLRDGYTTEQLNQALNGLNVEEKSELWLSGEIRERLGRPDLSPARLIDEHDLDEQAWVVTRRPKENSSPEQVRRKVEQSFQDLGFGVPNVSECRTGSLEKSTLQDVIDQGVQAVFEREDVVRTEHLIGEIVRLAPGQASNADVEGALKDRTEFVRSIVNGKDMISTRAILAEEQAILDGVRSGLGQLEPLISEADYQIPPELVSSERRVAELIAEAKARGEELSPELAGEWLRQHAEVHRYVLTSNDQFINVRGGAGVGKTFSMERLVQASIDGGRTVVLCAPYGEQSRMTIRGEAFRLDEEGKYAVAQAFREANTVASILTKAQFKPEFRETLRGADVYVDEASLLDNKTMLALVKLAKEADARVIFQGDTRQMHAVGRGRPLDRLERELKLGTHVCRIDVSRRHLRAEDKELARDLSSGKPDRFENALSRLIERGSVKEASIDSAVQTILESRKNNRETLVLSSTHRIGEEVSERLHQVYKTANPDKQTATIAAYRLKGLQPAELRSMAAYQVGDMIEYQCDPGRPARMAPVEVVVQDGVRVHGRRAPVRFEAVQDAYSRSTLERGVGESLVLTARIKQNGRIHENGSRQVIAAIEGGQMRFQSGLLLRQDDGRVRQGDVVTTYKAQGSSRLQMVRVEDNRSLRAMASREDLHVAFTRHRATAMMFVENVDVLKEVANRSSSNRLNASGLASIDRAGKENRTIFATKLPTLERAGSPYPRAKEKVESRPNRRQSRSPDLQRRLKQHEVPGKVPTVRPKEQRRQQDQTR
jgi:conjugative relaxase-like TrwC/TraI family protein